ncbi:MAG: hypothetical protein KAH07_08705 [Flavobacteriaceae bacterium]|nr:hypothetical protein [Flavobacteriaceae bacterium]
MKKISLLLFAAILLFAFKGNEKNERLELNSEKQTQQLKRYEVKSGIIIYETKTNGKVMGSTIVGSGDEKVYFKDWGAVELIEETSTETTTTKLFGKKSVDTNNSHSMTKLDNGETAVVDFKNKKIYMNRDMAMDMASMFNGGNAGDAGKSMAEGMGGEIVGKEKFLGYSCEIMEMMGSKQWIYKGVTLKIEMTLAGITTTKTATSAKFDVNVPNKYFELPDFTVVKQEGFTNNQDFEKEMEDMKDEMEVLKKMSYEEWKKLATENDEEMRNMSDKELREMYDMMQAMLKMQK